MATKQAVNSLVAPDGSYYVTITDGVGNLLPNPGNSALSNLSTGQVSVAATSTQIVPSRAARNAVTIINLGTVDVYIGNSNVTTATGALLPGAKGASLTLSVTTPVYGIASTGTQSVSYLETY